MPRIYRSYSCDLLLKKLETHIPEMNKSLKDIKVSIWGNSPRLLKSIIKNLEDYLSGEDCEYSQVILLTNTIYRPIILSSSYNKLKYFHFQTAKYKAKNAIVSAINKELKIAKNKVKGNRKRIIEINTIYRNVMIVFDMWWNNLDNWIGFDLYLYLDDAIDLLKTNKDTKVLKKSLVPGLQSFRWNKDTTFKVLNGLPNSKDRFFEPPNTEILKSLLKMKRKYGNVPIRK